MKDLTDDFSTIFLHFGARVFSATVCLALQTAPQAAGWTPDEMQKNVIVLCSEKCEDYNCDLASAYLISSCT